MLGEIERLNEHDQDNHQTRIWVDTERAAVDHSGTDIASMFRYWRERALLEDGIPTLANFNPPIERTPWLDVTAENPLSYKLHNHPAGVCGDWDSKRLAEYPVPMHAKSCALEYYRCKTLKSPVYIHIQQKMLAVEREYAKVLLPIADEAGDITRVIYAWRFTREPITLSKMY